MAISRRTCMNHPERAAIGVCVITQKPICGECATRLDGVNYSKEGLLILQERRASALKKTSWGARIATLCLFLTAPGSALVLYEFYLHGLEFIIDMDQWQW